MASPQHQVRFRPEVDVRIIESGRRRGATQGRPDRGDARRIRSERSIEYPPSVGGGMP